MQNFLLNVEPLGELAKVCEVWTFGSELSRTSFANFFWCTKTCRARNIFPIACKKLAHMSSPSVELPRVAKFRPLVSKICARVRKLFLVCKNMSRTKHFPLACKKKLTFIVKPLGELARVFEVQTVGFEMFLHEFANFCTNIFRSRVTFAKLSKFQILTTIFTHVGGNLGRRTKKVYDHVEPLGVVNTGLKQIRFRISCTIANFFCRIRRA